MKKSLGLLAGVFMVSLVPATNLNWNIKIEDKTEPEIIASSSEAKRLKDASSSTEDLSSSPDTKSLRTDSNAEIFEGQTIDEQTELKLQFLDFLVTRPENKKFKDLFSAIKSSDNILESPKKDLQLSDLFTFNVEPEFTNNTHFFYSKALVAKSPVVLTLKFKYLETAIFNGEKLDFFDQQLDLDIEKQELILTLKDEYKQYVKLFGGNKDTRKITFTFWLESKISEDEVIYYPSSNSVILLESLTSQKGNTKGCKIIQTAYKTLYCLQLQSNPNYTKEESKKYKLEEKGIIEWFGKDSEKHKNWIADQQKKAFKKNNYRKINNKYSEIIKEYEKNDPGILYIKIIHPWIDFDQSYYVAGTVDESTNNFNEIGTKEKLILIEMKTFHEGDIECIKIKTPSIYQLCLKDKWGSSYISYIEVGLENWKLKGSINDPILLEVLKEGIVTFEKDNLTSFDLYSNDTIYKKYWLMKYQSEVSSYINSKLYNLVYEYLEKEARGFEDKNRIKEIATFLSSSFEVKKKL